MPGPSIKLSGKGGYINPMYSWYDSVGAEMGSVAGVYAGTELVGDTVPGIHDVSKIIHSNMKLRLIFIVFALPKTIPFLGNEVIGRWIISGSPDTGRHQPSWRREGIRICPIEEGCH